jgi:hypothetical protein
LKAARIICKRLMDFLGTASISLVIVLIISVGERSLTNAQKK